MNWYDYVSRYLLHDPTRYSPLYLGGGCVGRIATHLEKVMDRVAGGDVLRAGDRWWVQGGDEALDRITSRLAAEGFIPSPTGERYRVLDIASGGVVGTVDRSAAIWFGVRTEGVHLNAFVKQEDGSIRIWLARRAMTHRQFPGQLDNLVAGGLAAGYSWKAALVEEAGEEAGIPASMLDAAHYAGTLSYCFDTPDGLVDSEAHVFDLEVPPSFTPRNHDGKVESFLFVSLPDAERLVLGEGLFKFNCGLVMLDFLARHHYLAGQFEITASMSLLRARQKLGEWERLQDDVNCGY
jgi:8-oxo-dGTP pyrophosphatase MutT (NUDIX family)